MADDVELVVPEVNGSDIIGNLRPRIIANPNCSTAQLVVAIAPLARRYGLSAVHVTSCQSVSGTGQNGIVELRDQIAAFVTNAPIAPRHAPIH